jgi:hypothetical protein
MLILITIFGLLLHGIMSDCVVMIDLVACTKPGQDIMDACACITSEYPSRGIASFICVDSTERARIDVSSKDIDSLLLSLFCTDSYSRRHVR